MSVILARPGSRKDRVRATARQESWARKAAWDLAKNIYKLTNFDKTAFLLSCGSEGASIISKITGRACVCCRFGSFYAYAAQKRFKPSRNGYVATMQDPHHGSDRKRGSSNKGGGISICSRSWPFRDSAITRRNASSFFARKALQRTPKLL